MSVTHGMNPDEVEGLGQKLKQISNEIQNMISYLNNQVMSTTWVGPDATTFKETWWPEHRTHLQNAANDLDGFGQSALNNATEQRTISGR